jgi:quercetin dioxygenase-like cupin family protein
MSHDADNPIIIRPGAGALVPGMNMVHKVDAGRLEGGLLIMEGEIAAGGLIPPHTHSREDECSYVLAGEVTFQVGDDVITATPGSYVIKPRGVPHAFWNSGGEPARLMEIHVPATFDRFYDELAATMADASMSDQERREAQEALHARYGLTFHWDRIPQLMQRYGVRP